MRRFKRGVPAYRSLAGIAASIAIVGLLFEADPDWPEPLTFACAIIAVVELLGVFLTFRHFRGEVFRLQSFGLTDREKEFVLELLGGKTMKEIAIDHGVSFSTVRNVFSAVYVKLGLEGNGELYALGALYKVE